MATDVAIHKIILAYGNATWISNEEMNDIKIIKSLEDSGLLK